MKKTKKAIVIATGKKVRVTEQTGFYWDEKAGQMYLDSELKFIERKHDVQIGLHFWRIGAYLFGREYLKYNSWFVVPGVSIDFVNGYDCFLDIEVKLLCIGFGIRFIWLKNWTPKIPLRKIFRWGNKPGNLTRFSH